MSGSKLPTSWSLTSVDEVAIELISGSGFPKEYQGNNTGDYPFAKVGDISRLHRSGEMFISTAEHSISEEIRCALKARIFPKGSIVFPKIGEALKGNYRVLTTRPMLFDNNVMGIVPNDNLVDAKYLFYFLTTQDFGRFSVATTVPSVRRGDIASISLGLPPRAEQHRIVAKIEELFSELDKGVESLTTVREQLRAYRQAVLKHAFEGKLTADWRAENPHKIETPEALLDRIRAGRATRYAEELKGWETAISQWRAAGELGKKPQKPSPPAQIESVGDADTAGLPVLPAPWMYVRLDTIAQIGSGMSVSKDRKVFDPIDVPYLRVANVQRGRLDLAHMVSMKIEKGQLPALTLKMWDVLFNEGGDRDKLGRGWVWEQQISPCITQNHVFRASPYLPTETQAKCISYWGNTYGQKYFDTEGKQTTNLASINKGVLSAFPVPLVPPQEQIELVRRLEAILSLSDSLEAEVSAALSRLDALRESILKKAFSGHLVAQDPRDEPVSVLLDRFRLEKEDSGNGQKKNNKNGKKEAA